MVGVMELCQMTKLDTALCFFVHSVTTLFIIN